MLNWFKKKNSDESNENITNPDYSEIDSNEKAIELYEKGKLVKVYLMPLEFGGVDNLTNYLYAPTFARDFKGSFDQIVDNLLADGKNLSYSAAPEYKGKSFIPSKIIIKVSGDSNFVETINIW